MQEREILHPLWVRVCHWVHAVCIVLLILTGFQMRFSDALGMFAFGKAVRVHNFSGFLVLFTLLALGGYYGLKGLFTRVYVPTREDINKIPLYANYYFVRYFFGDPHPFTPKPDDKFNSLQKVTYFMLMFILLPLQILTGLFLWDPRTFSSAISALGGIKVVDGIHLILAYSFFAFVIAHIYLATLGHTFIAHFKAMILGYED
ncbi:MAG: cytochrome B [Deltaproteobacteria bacterium]|nr:MAG: cytochrome B [Deltaproteobacteria bacterium]